MLTNWCTSASVCEFCSVLTLLPQICFNYCICGPPHHFGVQIQDAGCQWLVGFTVDSHFFSMISTCVLHLFHVSPTFFVNISFHIFCHVCGMAGGSQKCHEESHSVMRGDSHFQHIFFTSRCAGLRACGARGEGGIQASSLPTICLLI